MRWTGGRSSNAEDVEEAYLEIGKSHHEVICSLSYMATSWESAAEADRAKFKQNVKEFYFHAGCFLDNLARIIYILCDPNSHTANHKNNLRRFPPTRGGRSTVAITTTVRQRRFVDWGNIQKKWNDTNFSQYKYWLIEGHLDDIINVRNCLTHSWQPPMIPDSKGILEWPFAVRSKRDFLWPFDATEIPKLKTQYKKWVSIRKMMKTDLDYLERMQSQVFQRCRKSFPVFEARFGFEI